MPQPTFIVVSNRLPVTVSKKDGKLEYHASPGGLATAMSSVEVGGEMLWIGWPGITSDELTTSEKRSITNKLRKDYGCIPIFLTKEQNLNFYEGFSNETIWPLFHYFQEIAEYNDTYWESYKEVNQLFAKTVQKYADNNSVIWIHDYHLMLLPGILRAKITTASIGFFLHIPFPSFEIFRLIPQRKELLEGLLGADLLGFHIYDYVKHFTTSVTRTLGHKAKHGLVAYGDRQVRADAFPISIDYEKFSSAVNQPEVKKEIELLDSYYGDRKLILSVDRLDYSKGITHRLEAFETFLDNNPKYHNKVVLMMVAVPSRTEVEAYKDLREKIEQTVSRINGRYASVDWVPVVYQFQNQPFDKLVALYARSDVALVTPVRDGMNLVAKEYVATKQNSTGVLILSELTGAIDELPEALVINPNDRNGVAAAIRKALSMTKKQQKSKLISMQQRIKRFNVLQWSEDFIEQLTNSKNARDAHRAKLVRSKDSEEITEQYQKAEKRLFVLDYDGTLKEFVSSPRINQARPPRSLLNTIKKLCDDPKNEVYIVSGRPRSALDSWFGDLPIWLIAEHGYWIKHNGEWHASTSTDTDSYKSLAMPIMQTYTERTPGAVLEDKSSSIVWHYRNVSSELAYARKRNLHHDLVHALKNSEANVYDGNKILEVKPVDVNKGILIESIEPETYDFIFCAGDDYTDEDMFRSIADIDYATTIKVGLGETLAKYQVKSVKDILNLLRTFGS